MQPSWYSFPSWPHSDIVSLGRSVTCTFLSLPYFYSRDVFGIVITIQKIHLYFKTHPAELTV